MTTDNQDNNPFEGVTAAIYAANEDSPVWLLLSAAGDEDEISIECHNVDHKQDKLIEVLETFARRWNAHQELEERNQHLDDLTEYYAGQTDAALRSNRASKLLKAENEQLKEDNETLKGWNATRRKEADAYEDEIIRLKEENEKLKEELSELQGALNSYV